MATIFPEGMNSPVAPSPTQREVIRAPVRTRSLYRQFLDQDMKQGFSVEEEEEAMDHSIMEHSTVLYQPPKRKAVPAPIGEKVFTDEMTFKQAFKQARASGEDLFEWKGKKFTTEVKEPTTPFIPGFERERDVADIPPATEVGNRLYQTQHPINEQGENVRLITVGGGPDEPVRVIPSMVEGVQLSEEDAIAASQGGGPQFASIAEGERWNRAHHGKISPEGTLLSKDQEGGRLLGVKTTRTAPTFKMLEAMDAAVGTEATVPASPRIVTDELNTKREAEGLALLKMTSGYRSAQQNATAMMKNVEAAGSIEQARANGYTGRHYQSSLKTYYADPTRANLEAIGYIRLEREKIISGGHAGGDSADYSVSDLTDKADALKRVAWLEEQGYRARLENWGGKNKGANAHIHIDGIKH